MNTEELLLKTAFCCMACDGEIAPKEVALLKKLAKEEKLFGDLKIAKVVNSFVDQLNEQGYFFVDAYLKELSDAHMSEEEQLAIIKTALVTIKADEKVEYTEIGFFKQIREKLSIAESVILSAFPDELEIEDYLLPDSIDKLSVLWPVSFSVIQFKELLE